MSKKLSRSELEQKIFTLSEELSGLKIQHANELQAAETLRESEKETLRQKITKIESDSSATIVSLESDISTLESEVKEKQDQINKREIKKLAEAYLEQEGEFKKEMATWLLFVIGSLVALIGAIILTAVLAQNQPWYERFEYYFVNFVLVTFLIFSLKRYSAANRCRTDFANRKTLAQSYQNIISSTSDIAIQDRFLDKATDVLCAPIDQKIEAYTLPEKLMDGVTEVAKNLSRKT